MNSNSSSSWRRNRLLFYRTQELREHEEAGTDQIARGGAEDVASARRADSLRPAEVEIEPNAKESRVDDARRAIGVGRHLFEESKLLFRLGRLLLWVVLGLFALRLLVHVFGFIVAVVSSSSGSSCDGADGSGFAKVRMHVRQHDHARGKRRCCGSFRRLRLRTQTESG